MVFGLFLKFLLFLSILFCFVYSGIDKLDEMVDNIQHVLGSCALLTGIISECINSSKMCFIFVYERFVLCLIGTGFSG